jgi:small subunit ribosomal protein S1
VTTPESKSESFASLLAESDQAAPMRATPRVGERVDAVVSKIGKVAVFVTLEGNQEAYIDRAELLGKDGNVSVEVGSKMIAKVAEVGGRSGAIRLSPLVIKTDDEGGGQAAPALAESVMAEGMRVKGTVTRVERYGVFIQVTGTSGRKGRGLLPAAESGAPRGADLNKLFPMGSEVEAKIVRVEEDGKIRLSVTALKIDEERSQYESFSKSQGESAAAAPAQGGSKRPAEKLGTFGELLAKKLAAKK